MADMASQLEAAAVRLRRAGNEDLARELTAAMRRAVTPVPGQIRDGLKPHLPDPYAEVLAADVSIRTVTRNSGGDAAVSVYAKARGKSRRLKSLDAGKLAHPLWGDREHWYGQAVHPGWFTGPCEAAEPRVRAELEKALKDVGDKAGG